MRPIIVDSTQCHLWTDALHVRQLAREALNKWDRGTYVRMCVTTVWVALETSCQEVLNDPSIGYSFKANLDRALSNAGLGPLDWSKGVWQKVIELHEIRKSYVHRFLALPDMFPEASVADNAVRTIRDAVAEIYSHAGKSKPTWLDLDEARGWHARSTSPSANIIVSRYGARIEDPNTVKIFMVLDGEELLLTVLPSGYDPSREVEELLESVRVPISAIRVYENDVLKKDLVVNMRGNG